MAHENGDNKGQPKNQETTRARNAGQSRPLNFVSAAKASMSVMSLLQSVPAQESQNFNNAVLSHMCKKIPLQEACKFHICLTRKFSFIWNVLLQGVS